MCFPAFSNSTRQRLTSKVKGIVSSSSRRSKSHGGRSSLYPDTKAGPFSGRKGGWNSDDGSVEAAESVYPAMPSKSSGGYGNDDLFMPVS